MRIILKKQLFFILFCLLVSFQLSSQTDTLNNSCSIMGTISDSTENKNLPFINITLLSCKDSIFIRSSSSDINGKFEIKGLKEGNYIIRILEFSHMPFYNEILLKNDTSISISLIKKEEEIEEIIISGEKEIYRLEPDKRVYLTANDESIQNALAENALENTPGVYIDINGNVIIRGKPAEIMINGKQSRSSEHILNILKTIPASSIKKIEVITNPSAKYSATNTNSIVNIVLKKQISKKSFFALGTVINTSNVFGLWTTAFIKTKKVDFNIYILSAKNKNHNTNINRSYSISESDTSYFSELINKNFWDIQFTKLYSDIKYHISEKTSLFISATYENNKIDDSYEMNINRKYDILRSLYSKDILYLNSRYTYITGNIEHQFQKEGHKADFDFNLFSDFEDIEYSRKEINLLDEKESYRKSLPKERNFMSKLKVDYTYPLNKNHELSLGFDILNENKTSRNNLVDTSSNNIIWSNDYTLSYHYNSNAPHYQAYLTTSGNLFIFKYKIGLRYEKQIYSLSQQIPEYTIYRSFPGFYPSVHFSYQTKSKHNFSVSYGRKVNTPGVYLNPYIDRSDREYIKAGNSNLDLAGTDSYEFSYYKGLKFLKISASIYHKITKNDIIQVSELVFDDYYMQNVVLQTYSNCIQNKFTGTELSLSSNPTKNLKLNLYANTYYQSLKGSYNNIPLTNQGLIYNINFGISYKFLNNVIFNISPYYRSDNSDIFQNTKSNFYTRARLKFDLFKKRLSFDIKTRDIFGTKRNIKEYRLDNFYHYSEIDYITQNVQFIIIFRLGNLQYEKKSKINQLAR